MLRRIGLLFVLLFGFATPRVLAQVSLGAPLPLDPKVQTGTLHNGLQFYIRPNREPQNRAELRLAVRAGSILENEDQLGLAHFVEHMAFNGTQHFESQELVNYLESIGMRFGADINAYTSFDETVYRLTVPTDDDSILAKAFLVLADWARGSTFEAEEIEKERGVVIEEWRLGRGAGQRLRDQQLPVLLHGSRYAERLPIGTKEVLQSFAHETLIEFCRDWYKPELMAVIAVGDFDVPRIEALIRQHFEPLRSSPRPVDRPLFPVPEHEGTLFSIATDPEATMSRVTVYGKFPRRDHSTVAAYRRTLVENLFGTMLNLRLFELTQQAEPPFVGASGGIGRVVRPTEARILSVATENNGVLQGLDAVLVEEARAARHGFTETELERVKQRLLTGLESQYDEREKTESARYAGSYVAHFVNGEPEPGIEYEYDVARQLLPGIGLEEVDAVGRGFEQEDNRVVLVSGPEQEGVQLPQEPALRQIFADVAARDIPPYQDTVTDAPLLSAPPAPGRIVERQHWATLDVHRWTLSNGARVYVKATDFKEDEILFRGWSPGGSSLASDADYLSASTGVGMLASSGVGEFRLPDLQKKLAGKRLFVRPYVGELEEGVMGQTRPKDLETLLQLTYLYFTQPRRDEEAFQGQKNRLRGVLQNRAADPANAFGDTLRLVMSRYHPRAYPLTVGRLNQIDLDKALAFYRDRFADASDFTFLFVGNVDLQELEPLVCTYLGSLPDLKRKERWRDVGVRRPKGVVRRQFRRGLDPKARTAIVFHGEFDWNREQRFALSSLGDVLEIRLREVLREDLGGVYGVSVGVSRERDPKPVYRVQIGFGCDPERLDELVEQVFSVVQRFQDPGPDADDVAKVAEMRRKDHEVNLRENGYWANEIEFRDSYDLDLREILDYERLYSSLDVELVRKAARRYLKMDRMIQISMFPEEQTTPVEP